MIYLKRGAWNDAAYTASEFETTPLIEHSLSLENGQTLYSVDGIRIFDNSLFPERLNVAQIAAPDVKREWKIDVDTVLEENAVAVAVGDVTISEGITLSLYGTLLIIGGKLLRSSGSPAGSPAFGSLFAGGSPATGVLIEDVSADVLVSKFYVIEDSYRTVLIDLPSGYYDYEIKNPSTSETLELGKLLIEYVPNASATYDAPKQACVYEPGK